MKLISLELNDFRSYRDAKIEFAPTQNYVFGKNWQGKSTIMEGISYALFGRGAFPKKIAGAAVTAEELVRENTKQGFTKLAFDHENHTFVITRTCPKDRPILTRDGLEIASSPKPVREHLVELLGVDEGVFMNVFYSRQDELRSVFEAQPEQRRTFMERMLGYEYLKDVKLAAGKASDALQNWLEGFTSGNISTIVATLDSTNERVEWINDRLGELNKLISGLRDPEANSSKAESEAVSATKQIHKFINNTSTLKEKKNQQSELLKGVLGTNCPTCGQPITGDLRKHLIHQFSQPVKELTAKLQEAERQLKLFNVKLAKANSDSRIANSQIAELSGYSSEKNSISAELDTHRKNIERMKRDMEAYGDKPQVLKRVQDEQKFLSDLQVAIDEFRAKLRSTLTTSLENAANFFLSKFSDGDFDAQLRINEDFGFEVLLHGRPSSIFSLSGAARDILAISLRYGLYRVASKDIQFLLLDEPTHHFDSINTAKLKEALNQLSEQQLIVITVHDEFSDAIGKKFLVEKNEQLVSSIREL